MESAEPAKKLVYPLFDEIEDAKSAVFHMFGRFTEEFAKGDTTYSAPYCVKALKDTGLIESPKEMKDCDYSAIDKAKLEKISSHLVNSLRQFRPEAADNLEREYRRVIEKLYPTGLSI